MRKCTLGRDTAVLESPMIGLARNSDLSFAERKNDVPDITVACAGIIKETRLPSKVTFGNAFDAQNMFK